MSDVCALEGCAEPIEPQPDGAPPRKYCCQAHRTAARARRAAARREQEQVTASERLGSSGGSVLVPSELGPEEAQVPQERADVGGIDVPEPDPELEGASDPDVGDVEDFREEDEDDQDRGDEEPAFQRIGAAVRRVVDEDDEQQDQMDAGGGRGRAGGEVSPRSGREPISDEEGAGDRGQHAPSGSGSAVSRKPVPLKQLRKRPAWAAPRTAVAAGLAAAMVLGGGTALFDITQQSSPEALTPPPLPPGGPQWLDKANLALASTDTQLQMIDAAQQRWRAGAAGRPSTVEPPDVRALEARKAYLESQRSILASQIAAWQNLQQNNAALSTANAQLASLSQAADQPGQPSDVQQQIASQRATLQARSQMLADQAGKWQQDVTQASSAPMPDTSAQATATVISQVDDLGKGPKPTAPSGDRESGSMLAGRSPNSGDKERDLPGTAAPPRPDGESSQTAGKTSTSHDGVLAVAGAVTKPVTDTARDTGLLGGDGGKASRRGDAPGKGDGGSAGQGVVKPVQQTVGQVGGALVRPVDGLTRRGRSGAPDGTHGGRREAGQTGSGDGPGGAVGLLGDQHQDSRRSTGQELLGMRTVGDLVGKAMDAQQAQQDDRSGRSASKDAPENGQHSALMNLGGTTYRIGVPARSGKDSSQHPGGDGSGADEKSGKSPRPSDAGNSAARRVRATATSWANKLFGGSTGRSAGSTHSDSEHSRSRDSTSTNSGSKGLDRLITKYAGKSSGGSGTSIKELKVKHSNSEHSDSKSSDSKHSEHSGSRDSTSTNSRSNGLDRLITKYAGKSSGGSGTSIKELKAKHSDSKHSSSKDSGSGSSSKSSSSRS